MKGTEEAICLRLFDFIHKNKDVKLTILIALFALAAESFLLFHIAAEGITIAISVLFFIKATNRVRNDSSMVIFMSYALLAAGIIDFLHIITYHGMGIPIPDSANKSTQLWLASRYIFALSFLLAPFFIKRNDPKHTFFVTFSLVNAGILTAVFFLQSVPRCLTDQGQLTPFKIFNEYVILAIFLLSLLHFYQKRALINRESFVGITVAIAICILSEICFTLYIQVYSVINIFGHILKVLAYGFLYYAMVILQPTALKKETENLRTVPHKPSAKRVITLRRCSKTYTMKRKHRRIRYLS